MPGIDLGMTVTFVNNAQAGLKNLAGGVKQVGENAQVAHNRLKAIQVVIAGILLTKTIELGKSFLSMATSVQNLDLRLAKFAGGVPKATALMHRLNEEFGATGFSVEQLGKNWIKLQSVMNNNDKVTATLEAITNAVAAMGGNDGDIEGVTTAFQRMMGKGAPALKEVASLATQTGIKIEDLARASGMSFTQFDLELRKGLIKSGDFIDYFIKASKEKFGDFALGMHFTIGGAMNSISNSIKEAISDIGGKTDLFARITLVFNNIDKAFQNWAKTITQGDIDRFFTLLASWEQPIRNIASLIYTVGSALATMAVVTGQVLSGLPADIMEFGIIGYMIGGKKLGALFAMLAYIGDNTGTAIANLIILLGVAKEAKSVVDGVQGVAKNALGGLGSINTSGLGAGIFAGSLDAIKKGQAGLIAGAGVGPPSTDPDGSKIAAEAEKRKAYIEKLGRAADETWGKLNKMSDESGAGKLAVQLDDADNAMRALLDNLDKLLAENDTNHLAHPLTEQDQAIKDIRQRMMEINVEEAKRHEYLIKIHQLENQILSTEQQQLSLATQHAMLELRRSSNKGVGWNMLSATAGGSLSIDVENQKFDIQNRILDAGKQIDELQLKIAANENNPANSKQVEGWRNLQIELVALQGTLGDAAAGLSAAGEAGKTVWKEWGAAIESGVGDALLSVIDHTKTLGQIATQMYASITKAAANYLVKLGEIALMGDSASGGKSGTSGWMDAAFSAASSIFGGNKAKLGGDGMTWTPGAGGFAKGAAFHGAITPFANGGILNGPTMFGLAGEAGDEAIMPLRRGAGGKLGVAASGGSAVHIHINALDTQNAVEFIQKNAFHIGRALSHRSLLNRDMR